MRSGGFTLLELMLAITLMALLSSALYGGLFIAFKTQRTATAAVAPARTATLALELLQQDFSAALPPTGILAGAFVGTAEELSFFSCAHWPEDQSPASDVRKVEICLETPEGGGAPVLLRRLTTNLLAALAEPVREQVLCRGVSTFGLQYFDGTEWLDSWDSTALENRLPLAVKVILEFTLQDATASELVSFPITRVYRMECGQVPPGQAASAAAEAPAAPGGD